MSSANLFEEYLKKEKYFNDVMTIAKSLLDKSFRRDLKIHSLPARIKTFHSFNEKVRRKKIQKPFEEIHDIVGIRVICLFLDDIPTVTNSIEKSFHVLDKEDIIVNSNPDVFGYLGVHFKVKFLASEPSFKESGIANMTFEIQVRTVVQDAWASISHHLDYKKPEGISDSLRRDFYALSGLFHVADMHFKVINDGQTGLK